MAKNWPLNCFPNFCRCATAAVEFASALIDMERTCRPVTNFSGSSLKTPRHSCRPGSARASMRRHVDSSARQSQSSGWPRFDRFPARRAKRSDRPYDTSSSVYMRYRASSSRRSNRCLTNVGFWPSASLNATRRFGRFRGDCVAKLECVCRGGAARSFCVALFSLPR